MKLKKYIILCLITSLTGGLSAQKTMTGIEVLKKDNFKILERKRVGLITNPTGVDNSLKSTIDILFEAPNVNLVALYGPEHGVRGDVHAGDKVENSTDPSTGLPVYSLYGKTRKPTPEMLQGIDVLVYDIQDIGCRSFTYISTMGVAMEAAAENGIEFIVLDRPNPIGGEKVEGNLVEDGYISFVSQFKIPYIYGLTCGELARMLVGEHMLAKDCKLTVGYTIPFQMFAAEWIDADKLADRMNNLNLPGIKFRPMHLKPFYAFGKGEHLQGVQVHILDYKKARLSEVQFYIMQELATLYPDKPAFCKENESRFDMFDKVCGSNQIRERFSKNYHFDDIKDYWYKDVEDFKKLSRKYYLYK